MPKQTVKVLLRDFPNLKNDLERLKEDSTMIEIAKYYSDIGYPMSDSLLRRLFIKLNISPMGNNHKGKRNSFFGKHHSQQSKEKISKKRKEQGYSKGKKNYFYGKKGKLSPNWKGGKSARQALFYASESWASKRLKIMMRDSFSCQQCGCDARKKKNFLNVHHIVPLSKNWNLRLKDSNLITLCVPCHKKTFGIELQLISFFSSLIRT